MNTDNKTGGPPGKRRVRALEREKTRVRQTVPDLIAREAAEIASRQHENRAVALDEIRQRVTHNQGVLFERAFFECLAEWLQARSHEAATVAVRAFIEAHLDIDLRKV
ncbi:Arc family DNA-binding protein [Pararobbsia alpina]|uniref:hypothetical protein n=1 Tax=Pararobbsia alpina TaxID=621374 RepID=UPI0039A6A058